MLDQKAIESELKNYKVREGALYKRSKFLKEWRERWIVLTMNYLLTFTNKTCSQITDVIDLKEIKSYKSYLRKDEQMIPSGFKIRSQENMYYFCARNCNEKWSWLVTLERLMDYKYVGASTYNNADFIKTRGFVSQNDFQASKYDAPAPDLALSREETRKDVDKQAEQIMKELKIQKQQLAKKEQEMLKKQQELSKQEAMFVLEMDKVKKQEPPKPEPPKPEPPKPEPQRFQTVERDTGGKVSQLKNLFEKKIVDDGKKVGPEIKSGPSKVDQKYQREGGMSNELLHQCRNRIVTNFFQQFHKGAYGYPGLKHIMDFLMKISGQKTLGYQQFVVYEVKTHENRQTFLQIFSELIGDFKDYQNADQLARFVEVLIFEAAGSFTVNQLVTINNSLLRGFQAVTDESKLTSIIRCLFILQKVRKHEKNQEAKNKLAQLTKDCKTEQTRNWARKLLDQY